MESLEQFTSFILKSFSGKFTSCYLFHLPVSSDEYSHRKPINAVFLSGFSIRVARNDRLVNLEIIEHSHEIFKILLATYHDNFNFFLDKLINKGI